MGFEADIQGSGERGSNIFADSFSTTLCTEAFFPPVSCVFSGPLHGQATTAYDASISWFGTVRGRVGALISDQVLLYGTGGLAYGRVEQSGVTNVTGTALTSVGLSALTPGATAFSESKTNIGWTVGAGIEGTFAYWLPAGWTWKLEYLYVDLGSLDSVGPFPGFSVPTPRGSFFPLFTSPFAGAITTHTRFTDNILRVGLNYRFGN